MATINIAVNGKAFFSWKGNETAIENILDNFPRGVRAVGVRAEVYGYNLVIDLAKGALLSDDLMTGVIWLILTLDTHPGKVADYATFIDFDVDIERSGS